MSGDKELSGVSDSEASQAEEVIIPPRIGGIKNHQAWTGGSNLDANKFTYPRSAKAMRPTDYKSAARLEDDLERGLAVQYHLHTTKEILNDTEGKLITFVQWLEQVRDRLEHYGMDTVFRMLNEAGDHETYLLEAYGAGKIHDVADWTARLQKGLNGPDTVCTYDVYNLRQSKRFIINSISSTMYKTIEKGLKAATTGPEVLALLIQKSQRVSEAAVRKLMHELAALKLNKEPGENVDTFGDKCLEVARRIEGTTRIPSDLLSTLVSCFHPSSTPSFSSVVMEVLGCVDDCAYGTHKTYKTADDVVTHFKTHYERYSGLNMWEGSNMELEKETVALKAAVTSLKAEIKNLKQRGNQGGRGGRSGGDGDNPHAHLTCHRCKQKGHISRNCPQKQSNGGKKSDTPPATPDPKLDQSTDDTPWHRKAPATEADEIKTVDGVEWKGCKTCKRYFTGERAHTTKEHVKNYKQKQKEAGGNLAETPDVGGGISLRQLGGFFAEAGCSRRVADYKYCNTCNEFYNGHDATACTHTSYKHDVRTTEAELHATTSSALNSSAGRL